MKLLILNVLTYQKVIGLNLRDNFKMVRKMVLVQFFSMVDKNFQDV
jgi:hypothetical protein